MKPVRLLIAVVLLAAAGGALWWSNREEKAKEGKPPSDAPPQIMSVKPDMVKQLELHRRGDQPIVVVFNEKGKWEITAPQAYPADATAVAALTSATFELASERLVDANATDLASYGLAPAEMEVTILDKDGKKSKLLLGENTPTGNAVYAKLEGDPRLFTTAASHKTAFQKEVNDLRDKRLMPFSLDRLSMMALRTPKSNLEWSKASDGEWRIVKPQALRADATAADEVMNKLRGAAMDLAEGDPAKWTAAFNAGTPVGTGSVTAEDGLKSLEVRKNGASYYAKSSVWNAVYKTTAETATVFDKALDVLRNKKVFDFGFSEITRLEVSDSGKTVLLDKSNTGKSDDKWMSAGKTMDSTSVQQFIDKLRDLAVVKFADKGFGSAAVTLSVTSNQGKHKEKVEISPAGADRFVARHDGDAGLYELDAKAVKEMRQAVGDVREEQKSAPKKK